MNKIAIYILAIGLPIDIIFVMYLYGAYVTLKELRASIGLLAWQKFPQRRKTWLTLSWPLFWYRRRNHLRKERR